MNTLVMQPSDYWLDVTEAARRSGCTPQSVRMCVRKGQVLALKRYGKWLVNTRSLHEYMENGIEPKNVMLRDASRRLY